MKRMIAVAIILYTGLNTCVLGYRSTWFGKSAEISRAVLTQLDREVERLPPGILILLVNLPDHLEHTFTFRNTFPSAAQILGYDRYVDSVLDTALHPLSPQQQESYVDRLGQESGAIVFWYRNGELVPWGN